MEQTKRLFRRGQRVRFLDGERVFTIYRAIWVGNGWAYGLNEHPTPGRLFPERELCKP